MQTPNSILAPHIRCSDAKTPIDRLEKSQITRRDKKTDHRSSYLPNGMHISYKAGPAIIVPVLSEYPREGDPRASKRESYARDPRQCTRLGGALASGLFNTGQLGASHCAEVKRLV
jgi:hypothetical protein